MVDTRRSSSSLKRPLDSPLLASKESEVASSSSTEAKLVSQLPVDEVAAVDPPEVGSADLAPTIASDKPSDEKSPVVQVKEDAVVEEKDTKSGVKRQRIKKNTRGEAWARLIS